ncbi:hypothetical protein [Lacticaseibacillus kribbianus]|uniref:hypothetical protein n=1 Tax=Lacticaseibacillus kribbianus TaxID=2926292 RepID=UPI001CD41D06|nr:hypothetical protein [Lacticaseibacillus kribbianus]
MSETKHKHEETTAEAATGTEPESEGVRATGTASEADTARAAVTEHDPAADPDAHATLLPRNQDYYDRLAAYVTDAIGVDGVAADSTLAEIHRDLLQAQHDGIGAADYFGRDPQAIGDDIVANLPHRSRRGWVILGVVAWAVAFFLGGWRAIIEDPARVPVGTLALLALLLPLAILAITAWHRRRTFTRKKVRTSFLTILLAVQLVVLPLSDAVPHFGLVAVPAWFAVAAGFGLAALLVGFAIWLGLHSWVFAAIVGVLATLFAYPAADALGTLPGWWGRLMIPLMLVGLTLLVRAGDWLLPTRWQAKDRE